MILPNLYQLKVSDLIHQLQELQDQLGDVPVVLEGDYETEFVDDDGKIITGTCDWSAVPGASKKVINRHMGKGVMQEQVYISIQAAPFG